MRAILSLGLFLAGIVLAMSVGQAQSIPRPYSDYCNNANILYANGSNSSGPFPILTCTDTSVTYQRSNLAFPIAIVQNIQFSERAANLACQSAEQNGASAIVENIGSLCEIVMGRGFCSSCN